MKKITKAVIPAAGLGTRFLPATKALPKEMLPIIDTPNLQYIVEEAVKAGITDILLIISGSKKAIEDYFDVNAELEMRLKASKKDAEAQMIRDIANMANITFVHQKEPKGLGDAVLCAKAFAGDDPFAVLLGDDLITDDKKPAIGELMDAYYKTNGGTQLGCKEVPTDMLKKYGVVKPTKKAEGKVFQVCDMIEKPQTPELAPSNIAVLGRYVLPPEIFGILEKTKPGVGGEIQLTDAIKASMAINPCYACVFTGTRYDIGNKFGYIQAIIDYALKRDDLKDQVRAYLEKVVNEKK
jgi:UTP--glucose-1-phosphate uridylyltransferase